MKNRKYIFIFQVLQIAIGVAGCGKVPALLSKRAFEGATETYHSPSLLSIEPENFAGTYEILGVAEGEVSCATVAATEPPNALLRFSRFSVEHIGGPTNIPADKYLKSIGCEDTACARVWSSDVVLADSFAKGAWRYPISSYAQFHDQKISPSYFLQFIRTEIYPTTDGLAISNRRYQVEKASANSQFRAYIDQHADADEFHCAGVLNTKRLKRITVNL